MEPAIPKSFIHKRLARATEHVNNMWLPVNAQVLTKIRSGLDDGRYELGYDFLVDDLKSDVGLFFFCVRELSTLLKQSEVNFALEETADLFARAGMDRIRKVLTINPASVSRHQLTSISAAQAAQVQLALTSATTTEVLAEKVRGQGDYGFVSAMLRQLGLTLVAWNYPSAFDRALRALPERGDIDSELSSMLGFSPVLLAANLVRTWGGSSELVYVVGGETALNDNEYERRDRIQSTVGDIAELCRVGEALARANDPEHYPTARNDWETARNELTRRLGADALLQIRERLSDYCEAYREVRPELFSRSVDLSPEKHIHGQSEKALLERNAYIDACPLGLKRKLKDFYSWLPKSDTPRAAVAEFLNTVIPGTGFSGGAIYTFDTGTVQLVPRLRFGEVKLRKLDALRYEGHTVSSDAVLGAFHSTAPLVSRTNGKELALIVGLFGEVQKLGVLYFELPALLLDQPEMDYLIVFKAVRQTLHDCLGVR